MAKHGQEDFIIPALKVIQKHGKCMMNDIQDEIGEYILLSEEDLEPNPNRAANEPKYKQIVRNLISHEQKDFFQYVSKEMLEGHEKFKSPRYYFQLNDKGLNFLNSLNDIENIINQPNEYIKIRDEIKEIELDKLDKKMVDQANKDGLKKRPQTDQSIGKTVSLINGYKCEYGKSIGEEHKSFIKDDGTPFVEIHHLIPMKAARDFFPRNLDRPSNLVVLCPNCHNMIHHGSLSDREKVLRRLYNSHIKQLNEEEIYITFEDLLNKYYK